MALAGLVIGLAFQALGLAPSVRNATILESRLTWNYTTWLNVASLILLAALGWRFLRTGGPDMLRMMESPPDQHHGHHDPSHHHHGHHESPHDHMHHDL